MAKMTIDEMADFLGREELEVKNLIKAFQRNPQRAGIVHRGSPYFAGRRGSIPTILRSFSRRSSRSSPRKAFSLAQQRDRVARSESRSPSSSESRLSAGPPERGRRPWFSTLPVS